MLNFHGLEFNKEAGGTSSDAAGNLTYGGTNAKGQEVVNINIAAQYAGTSGFMLHEFKHADQYRTGNLGFYVNGAGQQVSTSNSRELEKAANYRGDVYSYPNTTGTYQNYNLQGYGDTPERTRSSEYHKNNATDNGLKYITGGKR